MLELMEQTTVVIDGYIVDVETGEIVGVESPEGFAVRDEDSAKWVLERFLDSDANIAKAEAVVRNAQAILKRAKSRREWLERRFLPELAEYAKANLPKGSKTYSTEYGAVSFRATAAKLKVVDEGQALSWAKQNAPEAVKVEESILVSKLPKGLVEDAPQGFEVVEAGESVSVKTGVEK